VVSETKGLQTIWSKYHTIQKDL